MGKRATTQTFKRYNKGWSNPSISDEKEDYSLKWESGSNPQMVW